MRASSSVCLSTAHNYTAENINAGYTEWPLGNAATVAQVALLCECQRTKAKLYMYSTLFTSAANGIGLPVLKGERKYTSLTDAYYLYLPGPKFSLAVIHHMSDGCGRKVVHALCLLCAL